MKAVTDSIRDEAMAWINSPECGEFCHALDTGYGAIREKAAARYRRLQGGRPILANMASVFF